MWRKGGGAPRATVRPKGGEGRGMTSPVPVECAEAPQAAKTLLSGVGMWESWKSLAIPCTVDRTPCYAPSGTRRRRSSHGRCGRRD